MVHKYTYKDLTWIDLISPTVSEVREIMEQYKIDTKVGEELLTPSLKPKINMYPNYMYLILHFPAFRHTHKGEINQEVDFVLGKNFLITAHYDTIDPLHKFAKVFEVNSVLDKSDIGEHAGFIFYYMIKKLYRALSHELDFISDRLKIVEDRIFMGNEKSMVIELSKIARELLQFKQALDLHDEVLHSFETASRKFFGNDFEYYAESIFGAYSRIHSGIRSNIDTLHELRATNDSLLSSKQSEVMKNIAIVSFIALPLSLVAGLFGMNTRYTPLVDDARGFFMIVGIMTALAIIMLAYFHHRRWL